MEAAPAASPSHIELSSPPPLLFPPLPSTPLYRLVSASSPVVRLLHSLGAFNTRHDSKFARTLGEHLLSTAFLLRLAGADEDVIDGGALHSVYSTSHYANVLTLDRARVVRAAGARAEALAFLFCVINRPRAFLALSSPLPLSGKLPLKLRRGVEHLGFSSEKGSAINVSTADVNALLLMEAANLLDQGVDDALRVAFSAPRGAPLRTALEHVYFSGRNVLARPALRQSRFCSSLFCGIPRLDLVRLLCAHVPTIVETPPQPSANAAEDAADGCVVLDDDTSGPLCPPHLTPILLAAPSPAHAALSPQRVGPTLRISAEIRRALEFGINSVTPLAVRGGAFSSSAIRAAAALPAHETQRCAFAAALNDGLVREGFLRVNGDGDARYIVQQTFAAAKFFFSQPMSAKCSAQRLVAGRPVGFVSERDREFFAVRNKVAGGGGGDYPQRAWRALFEWQRATARDIFSLLATHAGVLTPAGDAESADDAPSLDALFGERSESGAPDLMRVYHYSQQPADIRSAATSAHTDAGLLTIAPCASAAGLSVLSPTGSSWVDVESEETEEGSSRFIVFLGEAGARLFAGAVAGAGERERGCGPRATVHWVRNGNTGTPRYSAPFFLRAPADAVLVRGTGAARAVVNREFIETLALRPWARVREKAAINGGPPPPAVWAADFV